MPIKRPTRLKKGENVAHAQHGIELNKLKNSGRLRNSPPTGRRATVAPMPIDVAGVGDGITESPNRARRRKRRIQPRKFLRIYAPALDPTGVDRKERVIGDGPTM